MRYGFVIQSVGIEGFKGFTSRKDISFDGRHAFFLGKNGNGKSSIIEAIRWGLFGSIRRPNEAVVLPNHGYNGQCRVEVKLMRDGKLWSLRRTLNRGTTGGTDAVLTDDAGDEHSIHEVMPQIDSVDAGEGMHIIFAPQATPLRRQPEDLTAFERTVFNHLGLTNPRALLSGIKDVLEEQELIEDEFGKNLTSAKEAIDDEIANLEHQRDILLTSPPWGDTRVPSVAESEKRTQGLIADITSEPINGALSGASLDALVDKAESALANARFQSQEESRDELTKIAEQKDELAQLIEIRDAILVCQSSVQSKRSELDELLGEGSLEDLRESEARAEASLNATVLKKRVVADTLSLLTREKGEEVQCPVCDASHWTAALVSQLQSNIRQLDADESAELALKGFQQRLCKAGELESEIRVLDGRLFDAKQERTDRKESIRRCLSKELCQRIDSDCFEEVIRRLRDRENSLRKQIDNHETWLQDKQARLKRMRDECDFHQIQQRLVRRQEDRNRFQRVEDAFNDLVSFGRSVRAIRETVDQRLNALLEKDAPRIADSLSEVFATLTRHPWFDRLCFAKERFPKLELRVTSSQDPSGTEHFKDVLNGQAESALDLVPYFSFSQSDDTPTEVYLVMLDDPTRAFDEEHTSILVDRLADLGANVQLMVASQETRRFRELLPSSFRQGSYIIVEPTDWSYTNGPTLVIDNG